MSLWRRTRDEVAGAWRSLRYDLGKVPAPPRPRLDVTGSTTFGVGPGDLAGAYDEDLPRRPRRLVAVGAVAALAVAGGAGTYVAAVHGLAPALAGERPDDPPRAEAHPFPLAAEPRRPAGTSGMGRGARARNPVPAAPAAPAGTTPAAPAARVAPVAPPPARTPARTATPPEPPRTSFSAGPHPPVPTPTAPSGAPSPTPSPTPSASPAPSGPASAGPPTPTPSPSDSSR